MSEMFVERRWRSNDGLSLYARDYPAAGGDAKLPVVCIHGLTRNSRDFEDVSPWIAAHRRRVLAVDIRGRGLSDRDPQPLNYVPKTYASDVIALLDALGIAKAVFVGTSMGGLIMMAIAARRDSMIAAAIFNDVAPEIAPAGIERIKSYVGKCVDVGTWEEAAAYARATGEASFPALGQGDWERMARRSFRNVGGRIALDYDPAISVPLAKPVGRAAHWIAWLLFLRIVRHKPALLLRGSLSDIVTPEIAEKLVRRAPALNVVEVQGVGHAPLLAEESAREAMATFFDRIG